MPCEMGYEIDDKDIKYNLKKTSKLEITIHVFLIDSNAVSFINQTNTDSNFSQYDFIVYGPTDFWSALWNIE